MQRVIVLGNGKQVLLGEYIKGVKKAIANPKQTFKHGLSGWWPETGAEIRADFFRTLVTDHCNRGLTISGKDKNVILAKAYRKGRISVCRGCGRDFVRRNPFNDLDRYCSPECRL